jgi:hypothetical protein
MKRSISFLLLLSLSLWVGFASAQDPKTGEAVLAAEQWLSLVDAGEYKQSWREGSGYFKNAITEGKWVLSLQAVRNPLGTLISRKLISATYMTSLPGAPDGEYVVIQFETSFENKTSAIETVTPMREENGDWRVSGYYIK